MGLGPSLDFRSEVALLVPFVPDALAVVTELLVPPSGDLALAVVALVRDEPLVEAGGSFFLSLSLSFGSRVVTLAMGTVRALVR